MSRVHILLHILKLSGSWRQGKREVTHCVEKAYPQFHCCVQTHANALTRTHAFNSIVFTSWQLAYLCVAWETG